MYYIYIIVQLITVLLFNNIYCNIYNVIGLIINLRLTDTDLNTIDTGLHTV